jgi:(5-formylfuran-3-yl)methyl phosphate synthase
MTQLLISVNNLQETAVALAAGVDIIDLKDPNIGALGALDLATSREIVRLVDAKALTSATVGEHHSSLAALVNAIEARAEIGVDIIKMVVSPLFAEPLFVKEMRRISDAGHRLVAVFFADEDVDFDLLLRLQEARFYGAMLDTKNKQKNLLTSVDEQDLRRFTQLCSQHGLKSGLAGSLRLEDVPYLLAISPTYIGFRGGVCTNNLRTENLSALKVANLKTMLFKCNKNKALAQNNDQTALHTYVSLSIVVL